MLGEQILIRIRVRQLPPWEGAALVSNPLQRSQKDAETLLGECPSLTITRFVDNVLADALVKKKKDIMMQAASINQRRDQPPDTGRRQRELL